MTALTAAIPPESCTPVRRDRAPVGGTSAAVRSGGQWILPASFRTIPFICFPPFKTAGTGVPVLRGDAAQVESVAARPPAVPERA